MLDEDDTRPVSGFGRFIRFARRSGLVLMGVNGAVALTLIGSFGSVWDLHFVRKAFTLSALMYGFGAILGFAGFIATFIPEIVPNQKLVSSREIQRDFQIVRFANWFRVLLITAILIGGAVGFKVGFEALYQVADCMSSRTVPPPGCERQVERRLPPAFP